jgi:hypothetical protein
MQFLGDNWIFFLLAGGLFFVAAILNMVFALKKGPEVNPTKIFIFHLTFGFLLLASLVPALIGFVVAMIEFAKQN